MGIASAAFDSLWNEYLVWSAIVGGFTFIWLAHHSLTYRSKDEEDDWVDVDGIEVGVFPKHNDNISLELAWTIIPFLLIVYRLTFLGAYPAFADPTDPDSAYGWIAQMQQRTNKCYHIIDITAQQWFWSFECPEYAGPALCDASEYQDLNGTMVPVLSLKEGEFYLANLTSIDVTHSPWFVAFGVKEDAVPGLDTQVWIIPTCEDADCGGVEGESTLLLCTEYCGDDHAYMAAVVNVHK